MLIVGQNRVFLVLDKNTRLAAQRVPLFGDATLSLYKPYTVYMYNPRYPV